MYAYLSFIFIIDDPEVISAELMKSAVVLKTEEKKVIEDV